MLSENISHLTLPTFEVIRHSTKQGRKWISVHFNDPALIPSEILLEVLNVKREGFGSYSRIKSKTYGWVFPEDVWSAVVQELSVFDEWAPLKDQFEDAMEKWQFEVRRVS